MYEVKESNRLEWNQKPRCYLETRNREPSGSTSLRKRINLDSNEERYTDLKKRKVAEKVKYGYEDKLKK